MKFKTYIELLQCNFGTDPNRESFPLRHRIRNIEYVPIDVIGNFEQVK